MTRKQLSFELGYGSDAVTSWLNGRVQLGEFQVQCLCDYFGVTESSIVGDPEELADYKLYKDGRYICRGPLKELSHISGKDAGMLKYYAELHAQGKKTGNLTVVRSEE
jgi:hypothetical protein